MLTINKTRTFQQAYNIQNNKRSDSPRLQALTRDTVSFKANEGLFLEQIAQICKKGFELPDSVFEKAQAYAHSVVKTDPRIVAERQRIEQAKDIASDVKDFIFNEIWPEIGKGGGRKLS